MQVSASACLTGGSLLTPARLYCLLVQEYQRLGLFLALSPVNREDRGQVSLSVPLVSNTAPGIQHTCCNVRGPCWPRCLHL